MHTLFTIITLFLISCSSTIMGSEKKQLTFSQRYHRKINRAQLQIPNKSDTPITTKNFEYSKEKLVCKYCAKKALSLDLNSFWHYPSVDENLLHTCVFKNQEELTMHLSNECLNKAETNGESCCSDIYYRTILPQDYTNHFFERHINPLAKFNLPVAVACKYCIKKNIHIDLTSKKGMTLDVEMLNTYIFPHKDAYHNHLLTCNNKQITECQPCCSNIKDFRYISPEGYMKHFLKYHFPN